nr:hypothetical protein [Pseudonocardiales bacterium]
MGERAERVEFVPLSLDPAQVSWTAPGRSLAALRAGRSVSLPSTPSASIPLALYSATPSASSQISSSQLASSQFALSQITLPQSPALVCEGGVVVQANLAAVQLAGRWFPDSLTGIPLHHLLAGPRTDTDDTVTDAELIGPDGRAVPVRVTRWTVPGTDLLMVFLVDISDLCSARHTVDTGELAREHATLLEAQRIARIGSFTWDWPTNQITYSPALVELFAGRCSDAADPFCHIHPED